MVNAYDNGAFPRDQQLPEVPQGKYKPLGAWAYFGLNILYAIPVIGFIFLIVFSISDGNINRRNHARSYWIGLLITIILGIVFYFVALPILAELLDELSYMY